MTPKEERVWYAILEDRHANIETIAERASVEPSFVQSLIDRIGSPNWREHQPQTPVWPEGEGRKDDAQKARMDLVPPEIIEAVAWVLTFGAGKYGQRNWERGMNWGRPYAALMRHMLAWWSGEENDPETGYPHTWHAACCLAFLITYQHRNIGTDDRPTTKETKDARMAKETSPDYKVA